MNLHPIGSLYRQNAQITLTEGNAIEGDKDTINVKYGVDITNPRELAMKIKVELNKNLPKEISKIQSELRTCHY